MGRVNRLSRRDFLKLAGISLASYAFRDLPEGMLGWDSGWPELRLKDLPITVRDILIRVPGTKITRDGYLYLFDDDLNTGGRLPLSPTEWNLDRNKTVDELFPDLRWGIVLHWYGDPDYFDQTIKGYLRGFNSVRPISDFETKTSAHFLVGDGTPSAQIDGDENFCGIVQTQMPSPKGVPYLASHLNNHIVRSFSGDQYFVDAFYKLGLADEAINPVLYDLYEGPKVDPNYRTIAIEITGSDFDNPDHHFPSQKIANVLSVVWAVMKRYGIRAIDVMGHNEIQLSNSDPGKKFMALIRYLLGVKALLDGDASMMYQVFGPFLGINGNLAEAVQHYFAFVRDYLVMVGLPQNVYEWESWSKYWFVYDRIASQAAQNRVMYEGHFPLQGASINPGSWFLDPDNHEGIDIYLAGEGNQMVKYSSGVYLAGKGVCVFIGENRGFHHGKMAIFRHLQPDGAELLTVYGHLHAIGDIRVGKTYPAGYRLGSIGGLQDGSHSFLHFSTAYGATWDVYLRQNPNLPLSVDSRWVQRHFLHPEEVIKQIIT
jgi:hypothetical protein